MLLQLFGNLRCVFFVLLFCCFAWIHTYTHTHSHTHSHSHSHIHTHIYTLTHTHTHIHTYIHTYTYTYTHTQQFCFVFQLAHQPTTSKNRFNTLLPSSLSMPLRCKRPRCVDMAHAPCTHTAHNVLTPSTTSRLVMAQTLSLCLLPRCWRRLRTCFVW